MHARVVIVSAALLASSAFAAEPAATPVSQPDSAQPQVHRAAIVLASADQANPAPAEQQAQPAPHRARVARVTTCRCGDQQDQPDE